MTMDYKDVEIEGKAFRVGRMTATVGARILNVLLSAGAKAQAKETSTPEEKDEAKMAFEELSEEEKANIAISSTWIMVGSSISSEVYSEIQMNCLRVCLLYPQSDSSPIPVVMANGKWATSEIEKDLPVVNQLIIEALQFNLAPFFIARALKSGAASAQHQSPSRIVTASSSAQ